VGIAGGNKDKAFIFLYTIGYQEQNRGELNVEIQLFLTATVINLKRISRKFDKEVISNLIQTLRNKFQVSFFTV
jgi:hypothetical protein